MQDRVHTRNDLPESTPYVTMAQRALLAQALCVEFCVPLMPTSD
jgi:hypothetical protein